MIWPLGQRGPEKSWVRLSRGAHAASASDASSYWPRAFVVGVPAQGVAGSGRWVAPVDQMWACWQFREGRHPCGTGVTGLRAVDYAVATPRPPDQPALRAAVTVTDRDGPACHDPSGSSAETERTWSVQLPGAMRVPAVSVPVSPMV